MRRVILESPYSGKTDEEVVSNVRYARACIRDCIQRGEAPIASHLLFTQPGILDDNDPDERAMGIAAGFAWYTVAQACVVYTDFGISRGMSKGIAEAEANQVPVERRELSKFFEPDHG